MLAFLKTEVTQMKKSFKNQSKQSIFFNKSFFHLLYVSIRHNYLQMLTLDIQMDEIH